MSEWNSQWNGYLPAVRGAVSIADLPGWTTTVNE